MEFSAIRMSVNNQNPKWYSAKNLKYFPGVEIFIKLTSEFSGINIDAQTVEILLLFG